LAGFWACTSPLMLESVLDICSDCSRRSFGS
jgi:hypothetical protein